MAGTIVELARSYIDGELSKVADEIYTDMYAAISGHRQSGAAIQALKVQRLSDVSYFIGADVGSDPNDGGLHIKWLNDGNNSHGARLYPTRSKALNTPWGYKRSVRSHGGEHFIEKIASKYR